MEDDVDGLRVRHIDTRSEKETNKNLIDFCSSNNTYLKGKYGSELAFERKAAAAKKRIA